MTYTFKLSRRIARLRAPLFAALILTLAGCDDENSLGPGPGDQAPLPGPVASAAFAGGIPIGFFAQPTSLFGDRYNGAHQNISPNVLLEELAVIKARGSKVILSLSGSPTYYVDDSGGFSLSKWKARVDRYKGVNFSAYIKDGTVIGHYMIDEPNDPANWDGEPVPPSMLEEMGRYSKQLWPDMPTIVRVEPSYLNRDHRYVDAAWAQYLSRRGAVDDYIQRNVTAAQERGLALVVGLNVLRGGTPNGTKMTASQVESWGSTLLSSSYPCAFISWEYDAGFLSSSGMGSAMDALRRQAENRSTRSCRAAASGETPTPSPPPPSPEPPATEGVPFGPYGLPGEELSSFSGSVRGATPDNVVASATAAREAGARVFLRVSGNGITNSNGTFSLTKWKAAIDRYAGVNLSSFVSDGSIAGHLLVQNPQNASAWGGQAIPYATLEEMARYSRLRWPGLTTIVQAPASWLAANPTPWQYLDAATAMYAASTGDAATWLEQQATAAGRARIGLLIGMNVLNGGTSASGIPGTIAGKYAMSASQLRGWGSVFASHSRVCGLVLASWDVGYFGRSDVTESVAAVAEKARLHATTSCRVRS